MHTVRVANRGVALLPALRLQLSTRATTAATSAAPPSATATSTTTSGSHESDGAQLLVPAGGVWRHRPSHYSAERPAGKQWKHMDRASFRRLLEECMAVNTVSSVLRKVSERNSVWLNRQKH